MTTPDNPGQPPTYGGPPPGYGAPQAGYGAAQSGYGPSVQYAVGMQNGLGIAALILGIFAILTSIVVIGALFGLLAIGLGFAGRSRVKKGRANNGGVALTGIITGIIGILISVAVVVGVVAIYNSKTVQDLKHCLTGTHTTAQTQACEQKYGGSSN